MNTEQLTDNVSSPIDDDNAIHLDYSLKTCEERMEYIKQLLPKLPKEKLNNSIFLDNLSSYVVNAISKQEKKERKILTDNRMVTINKRETSFEGILDKLEFEDSIYSFVDENKQTILTPKISITKQDLEDIPILKDLKADIAKIEAAAKTARGQHKYRLKKWLIELRQDQYVIKDGYRKPQRFVKITHNLINENDNYDEEVIINEEKRVSSEGTISLYNPKHIGLLLHYYSELKQETWGHFDSDIWAMMLDLDNLIERAFAETQPMLYDILIMKIDGMYNVDISEEIDKKYGKKYTNEYISSLWRRKIPKLIAEAAEQDYLEWYYTVKEKGKWKKCSRCGQVKLAHNFYFSKNKSSRDGLYSICKCCRNAKTRAKKEQRGEK